MVCTQSKVISQVTVIVNSLSGFAGFSLTAQKDEPFFYRKTLRSMVELPTDWYIGTAR